MGCAHENAAQCALVFDTHTHARGRTATRLFQEWRRRRGTHARVRHARGHTSKRWRAHVAPERLWSRQRCLAVWDARWRLSVRERALRLLYVRAGGEIARALKATRDDAQRLFTCKSVELFTYC